MSTLLLQFAVMTKAENSSWPLEPEPEALRVLLDECTRFVVDHLRSLPEQPSFDLANAGEEAASFREPVPQRGQALVGIRDGLAPAGARPLPPAGPGQRGLLP